MQNTMSDLNLDLIHTEQLTIIFSIKYSLC